MTARTTLFLAAAIRDAAGVRARPGAVAVADGRIRLAGTPQALRAALGAEPHARVDLGAALLLPAFVNAHAHLDLHPIGPRPFGAGGFLGWIGEVMRLRSHEPDEITAAVHAACRASRAAGVGWVGDIAGSPAAVRARCLAPADARLGGVAWLERFGGGARAAAAADAAEAALAELRAELGTDATARGVRIDLQPHAPYSAGDALFARAAALGAPATHLAETPEEARFVRDADGPFAELLRRIGAWDDSIVPRRTSPIGALAPLLARAPWVVAHVNYADDADLDRLAALPDVTVAYCPVASAYFGHVGHRYREMHARGIRVALGTDSVLCQPPDEPAPYGILPQARLLARRDGTDPDLLLAMATVHGARALRLPTGAATLAAGAPATLATVAIDPADPRDPWHQALAGDAPMQQLPIPGAEDPERRGSSS